MKKILLIALLSLFFGLNDGFSQNSASINLTSKPSGTIKEGFRLEGGVSKNEKYLKAISEANLETYRLMNKEVVLKFEEGFNCVLLSAETLKKQGVALNPQVYNLEHPDNYKLPVFSILGDGTLKATYECITK